MSRLTPRCIPCAVARRWALASVAACLALETAAAFACDPALDLTTLAIRWSFLLIPLSPALIAAGSRNPLCAIPAAASVAGWIVFALQAECLRAGPAGTAATAYYAVWVYGFISAALLALLAGPVLRVVGVRAGGCDDNTPPSQA